MPYVRADRVRDWMGESGRIDRFTKSIGRQPPSAEYLEEVLGLPLHVEFAMRRLVEEDPSASLDLLASIPFFSLCKGLFLPLSGLAPERVAALFGFAVPPPPRAAEREALVTDFLGRELGLTLEQKLSCLLGDPFRGRPGTLRRDSLVRLLESMALRSHRELLDRLTIVGDVAVLFAESRPTLRADPPLTAAEVLEALRFIPEKGVGRKRKFALLRSLVARCGKLEAYFLAKLVERKAGFGFDYQGAVIARALGAHFAAPPEIVAHAMALTDVFHVMRLLEAEGAEGLRQVRLQPLVPVRPALASGSTDAIARYPVWVERKYDGIRFMLHKSTDRTGNVLCGAYTRTRRDWLELVNGLRASIQMLPVRSAIVDGELYGIVVDGGMPRPATVYEVHGALQGDRRPVNLRFAAFDVLYVDSQDLTGLPLRQRRQRLQWLVGPLESMPLAVPMTVAEGQVASNPDDVRRLFGHFRSQGYEGLVAKDMDGAYKLATRDPSWTKRKPEVTLDLVLLGAVFAVTGKENVGMFGSYVIGARSREGSFVDVGDVAGVDKVRDAQIQSEIMREGLITGRRIERKSASGVRPGMDLRPHIVVTVRFEGVVKDDLTGDLRLRGPKLVQIRSDKSAFEADTMDHIEKEWLRQRMR